MCKEKTTTIALKVTEDLAALWKLAAEEEGHPNVARWLRSLAQTRAENLQVKLPEKTLTWNVGTFVVEMCGSVPEWKGPVEVKGIVAGPFGIFRGSGRGACHSSDSYFSLALVACHTVITRLGRQKDCKKLALRLFPLKLDWYATDPQNVGGSGVSEARVILHAFKRGEPERENRQTGRL